MNQPAPERLIAAHEDAARFYRQHLPNALPAIRFLTSRGIIAATAHQPPWTLGYAPRSWIALRDHLRNAGYTDHELLTAGLITTSRTGDLIDVFRDRVMFPIRRAHDSAIIAFTGRDVSDWPGAPKYRNTATTPTYRKRDHLHGLAELATRDVPPAAVLLVEGPADAVAAARLTVDGGPVAAVSPCGIALTDEHVTALTTAIAPGTPLIVALDADAAGQAAADRAYAHLRTWPGPLEVLPLPAGTDPAELVVRGRDAANAYVQQYRRPLAEHLTQHRLRAHRIDEVPGSLAALHDVAPLLADIAARDTDRAAQLCTDLAAQLHLDPLTVLEAVYPTPATPPPRTGPPPYSREPIARPAPRLPDLTAARHEYAMRCPPDRPAAVRVHHYPRTGRTAWALAEGVTDSPGDRAAARLAAEVAARTALTVGPHAAIELARTAVNTRFTQPGTGRGDAAIAVLTSPESHPAGHISIAWAGAVNAYAAGPTWFTPLTSTDEPARTSSVRGGTIAINHIRPANARILVIGHSSASWPTETIRDVLDGRRPQQSITALLDLEPATAIAIRIRATPAQLAAQQTPAALRDRPDSPPPASDAARRPSATPKTGSEACGRPKRP
ncbi:toprim domain-containing protein [Catenuloplanes sp. NPDC051500]|uniref:toprim domain-containing protein n=1 Tax=Catenuloplanes sp. NPDC051500 TaxID=3363959 RepID=UPI0037AB3E6E